MKKCLSCNKVFTDDTLQMCPDCNSFLCTFEKTAEKIGYFYILINQLHEDYVKIGICTGSVDEVIKQKNADMLLPYEKFISIKTKKYKELKHLILCLLEKNKSIKDFIKVDLVSLRTLIYKNILPIMVDAKYEGPKTLRELPTIRKNKKTTQRSGKNGVHRGKRAKNYEAIREASNEEKLQVWSILTENRLSGNVLIKGIAECIIANGGEANITRVIIPYIKEYYPEFYTEKYVDYPHKFNSYISTTVRSCPMFHQVGMGNFELI